MDPERPWKTESVRTGREIDGFGLEHVQAGNPVTVLERLSGLESQIPRLNKEINRLNERIDELVRLLGA